MVSKVKDVVGKVIKLVFKDVVGIVKLLLERVVKLWVIMGLIVILEFLELVFDVFDYRKIVFVIVIVWLVIFYVELVYVFDIKYYMWDRKWSVKMMV